MKSRSGDSKIIKGKQSAQPGPGLVQGFSASGPDVWVEVAHYDKPGVVVSAVGARCGKTFLADPPWTAIANTHALIPDEQIDVRYLWYVTNREDWWIKGGTAQPFVKVKDTLARPILIPPLDEQRRIVAKLDEALAEIEVLRANVRQRSELDEKLRISVLNRAFASGNRDEWEAMELGDCCRLINGRAYKKAEFLPEGPYPVLRVGNFFTNKNWVYSDLELAEEKYCVTGDLLYAWSASFGPRIWKGPKSIYHYHIWKVVPDPTKVTREFLYRLLQWDAERIGHDLGTGATMIHVTKRSMECRPVLIPPIPVQEAICSRLSALEASLDDSSEAQQRKARLVDALTPAYLDSQIRS